LDIANPRTRARAGGESRPVIYNQLKRAAIDGRIDSGNRVTDTPRDVEKGNFP